MSTAMIADPFSARDDALARLDAAKAEAEVRLIEQFVAAVGGELRESASWEPVDRFDHDPEERSPLPRYGARRRLGHTTVWDRTDGRFLPFYEDEFDLRRTRQAGRSLAAFSSIAVGAMETLDKYVVGTGFTFRARAKDQVADESAEAVVADVQRFIDRLLDANNFTGGFDLETHRFAREDGDRPVVVHPRMNDVPRFEALEPEQVTEPPNRACRRLEAEIGCDDGVNSWTFGVHTRADEDTGRHDPSNPVGYHVIYDQGGLDWDYFEADRVQLFKRNAPQKAKRGVTDFFPVIEDAEGEGRLNRNIREGMALLACIPFVKEYSTEKLPATSPTGLDIYTAVRPAMQGGTRPVSRVRYQPGTVPEIRGGRYAPGPLSQMRGDAVIEVAKSVIRRMGTRWSLPAFMLTGDVESGLYTSVLAVGSPFTKAREQDQTWLGQQFVQLIWKAVKIYGRQGRFRWPLEVIERLIDIDWEGPAIALTTDLERAQRQQIEVGMGTLSRQTASEEAGRDWEKEVERGADPSAAALLTPVASAAGGMSPASPLATPPAETERTPETLVVGAENALNGAQITAAISVLAGVVDRSVAPGVAAELLTSLGIAPERASSMVSETVAKAKPVTEPSPQFVRAMEAATPEDARRILFERYP